MQWPGKLFLKLHFVTSSSIYRTIQKRKKKEKFNLQASNSTVHDGAMGPAPRFKILYFFECLVSQIGFDTADNELFKFCQLSVDRSHRLTFLIRFRALCFSAFA